MKPIERDLHDHLLRKQLQQTIEQIYADNSLFAMKEMCEVLAECFVMQKVVTKYFAKEAAHNLGTLPSNE